MVAVTKGITKNENRKEFSLRLILTQTSLDNLMEVARNENQAQVVEFAEKLKLHAKTEEEVTYPTALLIGEYLKLKLN
jgi:hypothetical protein